MAEGTKSEGTKRYSIDVGLFSYALRGKPSKYERRQSDGQKKRLCLERIFVR